jgi:tetratricopeptide (TPR) repeat protein
MIPKGLRKADFCYDEDMGILDLFAKPPDAESAGRLLREGREKLWLRQTAQAAGLFDKAARCPQTRACALAYRSLAKRMKQDLPGAGADADAAIAAQPDRLEGHFARIAALLSGQQQDRIVQAFESWERACACVPQDAEAHFLSLLLLLLFAEMTANASEDASGVTLSFRHTPVVRGAIRLLDGHPELAGQEFAGVDHFGSSAALAQIGRGLAFYRQGRKEEARSAWNLALSALQGKMAKELLSLKRLLAELEKQPKIP